MKKNKQNLPTCFINLLQINYAAKLQKKKKILLKYATFFDSILWHTKYYNKNNNNKSNSKKHPHNIFKIN